MVLVVTSAALLDATREPIRGWNKIVQSSSMRNKYLSKLIVIEATLFKHEMTNGQEELILNLIGLNIIIAVYCNGCVKKWSSGFEKRFQEAITWQRLWIPIYSIYWFFVKNHRCCTMVRQTQIHRKSNFRILRSEGAQKLRTYITKKTPKKFLFITCSLGATAISANPVFHEKGDFRVIFPILIIELCDQNYKTGNAILPNYPSSPIFLCQCSP